ncbi:MAG: peptide ABC transporter substrate-binding protein [Deltaproteobacteria bacterium RIFOXYC2_FULL_48_10]|nr:MAG: peptide ABC transporter substrate-binding protein [Deltaproteobacteria bacterium RIFOXYC2_FULL_48_10]OGR31290.1 MAG: peptide ABC transporter substrate-binding protein [Desulfobacula sp. RIFOXYB2_FULL_45_6]
MRFSRLWIGILVVASVLGFSRCRDTGPEAPDMATVPDADLVPAPRQDQVFANLPENIQWLTNESDPVFSSEKAIKGGRLRLSLTSFPMTFRVVGPDSNGSFRSAILDNHLSLIAIHPDTGHIIPELATHWAFGDDKKTMYFKLDREAQWSDKRPVTARDYAYTLEFMRSEHIMAPWYNDYYTKEIEAVIVYDDYTIGVRSTKADPDLYLKLGIGPLPAHFFGRLDETFVQTYNWKIVPNTGPYEISEFKKGRSVTFKRKQDWWARDRRYQKNRFNVDIVVYNVIRDPNLEWEYFKKGLLDVFSLTFPKYWHEKSDQTLFHRGYIHKIWFFNDMERSAQGIFLNQDKEIFRDRRLCYAFAHAMNIEKVITNVLRNDYFRLPQAFSGYGDYTDEGIKPRLYDIGKVETLMTEAGWTRGAGGIWQKGEESFSVRITYGIDEHTPRLVVLKEEALKAGIDLVLDKLDTSSMFKKILEKKHDAASMGWSTNIRPTYWEGWHSENAHKAQTNNITNTDDLELDRLIDQYRASLDEEERKDLSRRIQRLIHETGAFVPTFMVPYVRQGYWRWLELPDFHGTKRSDNLFDPFSSTIGGLFWIDPDKKEETLKAVQKGESFPPAILMDERFKPE